jgi:hypothetical protein
MEMQKSENKRRRDDEMDKDIKSAIECVGTVGDRLRGSSSRFSGAA